MSGQTELFPTGSRGRTGTLDPDGDLVGVRVPTGPGLARGNSPETSHRAAAAIRGKLPSARERVLSFLAVRGERGATDEEISEGLGMRLSGVCARRNELMKKSAPVLVLFSGGTRVASTGMAVRVYTTTRAGYRLAQRIDLAEGG